ncbi:hypothetical protein WDU94_014807, partial [Cyamophila willieti]
LTKLYLSSIFPGVFSLKCFQCNSRTDPDCPFIVPNMTSSIYLQPCPAVPTNGTPLCRKIVQTVAEYGINRVVRKCGYQKNAKKDCYDLADKDHSERVCQCFSDACNSSPQQLPGVLPGILTALFSVTQYGILKFV